MFRPDKSCREPLIEFPNAIAKGMAAIATTTITTVGRRRFMVSVHRWTANPLTVTHFTGTEDGHAPDATP
jgi:hypothetical protein